MKYIFDVISKKSSKLTTQTYSTSFSLGIRVFRKKYHNPIYSIYGFVRFADEIVDSFHGFDKVKLFEKFERDTWESIEDGISMNPILNSFQWVVNKYSIDHELIKLFLRSMEMDLEQKVHDDNSFKKYILGSAEVVGLMCLKVFVEGDEKRYEELRPSAMSLGSAFQKVNFLRDLNADKNQLGRSYFPDLNVLQLNEESKAKIIEDIEADFKHAYTGIKELPKGARFGVYVAYIYYLSLLRKIKRTHSSEILKKRVRIPNREKYGLLLSSAFKHAFNLL
ncbi:MAG: phytoene/squalene synthase family protein [Bacteroidales bacterium]|nr:phytoene/squalene synthase family protein [Bacteroidales bacterium]MCF8402933.1 phytoene/squalene synthase family protein [Bacteroidales bacterium]